MVSRGTFREDLYYRLKVVTLRVPPLRERLEDVPLLARSFARQIAERMGRRPVEFDDEAVRALQRHSYPGNVRELMNIVERVAILADGQQASGPDVLGLESVRPPPMGGFRPGSSYRDLMREAERRILSSAIEAHGGNKSAAARSLEIDRSHFFKKLRDLDIGGD